MKKSNTLLEIIDTENQLEKIQAVITELQKLKRIENLILYRKNKGLPKDGSLFIDFEKSRIKSKNLIDSINKKF